MDVRSADHTRFRGTDERDFSSLGRVMLVASHRTMRQALRQALEALGLEVTTDTPPGREALLAALCAHPHVVLVDVATDPSSGIETCRQLRHASPAWKLIALAPRIGPAHEAALAAGAYGIVTTDTSVADLATVLVAAARGGRHPSAAAAPANGSSVLTHREQEVLALAATGLTDGQISHSLYISHKTVKNHLHHVYTKLGARGRTDAVMLGLRHGLISL